MLGFVNVDDEGVSGLELYYDDIFKGTLSRLVVQRGGRHSYSGGTEVDEPAVDQAGYRGVYRYRHAELLEKKARCRREGTIGNDDGELCLWTPPPESCSPSPRRLISTLPALQFGGGVGFPQNCERIQ